IGLLFACVWSVAVGCGGSNTPPAQTAQNVPTGDAIRVLRGVRVIDGSGAKPIENAAVGIDGERISWVGPDATVHVPSAAVIVREEGKTLIPGLISIHSHLGMVDGTSAKAENGTRENILRQLAQYEAYGVTTVTSLGFNGDVFYALQPELHRGALPGADAF